MNTVTRRSFVTAVGAATLASVCSPGDPYGVPGLPTATGSPAAPHSPAAPRYVFFDHAEAEFVTAACDRLIPDDESGPGALAAGVVFYLDRQLAGPWGAGEQRYRAGSWQPGSPTAVAHAPAALFRITLHAIDHHLGQRGTRFSALSTASQDALLAALQDGTADLPGIPSAAFFATLLTVTVEGFFSHPHGARRDRIAWRLPAYPGAHASYNESVTNGRYS